MTSSVIFFVAEFGSLERDQSRYRLGGVPGTACLDMTVRWESASQFETELSKEEKKGTECLFAG